MSWDDDFFAGAVAIAKELHEYEQKRREKRREAANERRRDRYAFRKRLGIEPKPKPKPEPEPHYEPHESCYCFATMPPCTYCEEHCECAGCGKVFNHTEESYQDKGGDPVCPDCAVFCQGCATGFGDQNALIDFRQGWYCPRCVEARK